MGAIFGFTGSFEPKLFAAMQSSLSHRGLRLFKTSNQFATIGYWSRSGQPCDEDLGNGLFQADSVRSPMHSETQLALAGFQTPGQSGTILSHEEIASKVLENRLPPFELSGDFVAAINSCDKLVLIRDGSGCRTIYYAKLNDRLLFASEPKAIWSAPGFQRKLNEESLLKYLSFSFVPESPTMLDGLQELPAGHVLIWDGRDCLLKRYFQFESEKHLESSSTDLVESFHATLKRAVSDRLSIPKNDPVVFLSGGLDSSVIAAEIRAQTDANIRTFSLHFGEKYPNELSFARQVATQLRTEHREVLMEPHRFLGELRKMIWHLDDPIGDPITMPNYSLAQIVSSETDYVFNGEGGDPCLGGPKNLPMMLTHWYGEERGKDFRELAYLESFRRAYEEIDYIFDDQRKVAQKKNCLVDVLRPYLSANKPSRLLDKLQLMNVRLKGAHLILPKVERMLGAHDISPMSPLFSSEIVRHSFALPPQLKLNQGIEKVVLKKIYKDQLPKEVIERPKSGMRVPVHFWFQGELKKYARKILGRKEIRQAGIFNPDRVKQLLDYNIEEGNGRYGIRLWMLITFEIWRRIVIEGEAI